MTSNTHKSLRLFLIRHGETSWSIAGKHTGKSDIPLTKHGEQQARQISRRLAGIEFDHVFSSPLLRAHRTAELAGFGRDIAINPDLQEWDYGDYEGQISADILLKQPDWNIFQNGCPNGEMPAHLAHRADRLIQFLQTLTGDIALFTHGQFAAVLAVRWLGLPVLIAQHFPMDTAALSILSYDPHHPEKPVIGRWNDTPLTSQRAGADKTVQAARAEPVGIKR